MLTVLKLRPTFKVNFSQLEPKEHCQGLRKDQSFKSFYNNALSVVSDRYNSQKTPKNIGRFPGHHKWLFFRIMCER